MEKNKQLSPEEQNEEVVLNEEEQESIIGGANPFADKPRVKTNDYDEDVKSRI